jgi:hypothetical protein
MGRTPLQGASLDVTSPRPEGLGYSVRPLRGHKDFGELSRVALRSRDEHD